MDTGGWIKILQGGGRSVGFWGIPEILDEFPDGLHVELLGLLLHLLGVQDHQAKYVVQVEVRDVAEEALVALYPWARFLRIPDTFHFGIIQIISDFTPDSTDIRTKSLELFFIGPDGECF